MENRIVFYPTLYKSIVIHTPPQSKNRHADCILRSRFGRFWFTSICFRIKRDMNIPIIQGYKKPVSVVGGGKYNCLTTEIAHRTNSYGLPHVLTIYELWQQYTKWKISPNRLGGAKQSHLPMRHPLQGRRKQQCNVYNRVLWEQIVM